MEPSSYTIKTHIFEGPLETLLSLIEKRKLFINDISLAQVADDYIAHVKSLEDFPIGDSAHFILIASTLVLIKSKSLLPTLTLTEDEQSSIEDLEKHLIEYQKYKALSRHLKERFGIHTEYLRLPSKEKQIVFTPDEHMTVTDIREAITAVIRAIPKKEFVPTAVVKKVISLEEMIENLTDRIAKGLKMSFKDFSRLPSPKSEAYGGQASLSQENKIHIIISFLAMLELVKQGIIMVRQDKDFHDIEMETQTVGVPRY